MKKFGRRALLTQKETVDQTTCFNSEELYFLNRIVFKLLKEKGPSLRFERLVDDVETLQCGPFNARLRLWLNCVCELEEDIQLKHSSQGTPSTKSTKSDASEMLNKDSRARIISKTKFNNVIRASFPQDVTLKQSFETIVDTIFSKGLDDFKALETIHSFIMNNLQAKQMLYCVLQFTEDEESLS